MQAKIAEWARRGVRVNFEIADLSDAVSIDRLVVGSDALANDHGELVHQSLVEVRLDVLVTNLVVEVVHQKASTDAVSGVFPVGGKLVTSPNRVGGPLGHKRRSVLHCASGRT